LVAIQQMTQIVPVRPSQAAAEGKPVPAQKKIGQQFAARVGTIQEIGGLVGRVLLLFWRSESSAGGNAPSLAVARPDYRSGRCLFCSHPEPLGDGGGHLHCRAIDCRSVQLLGNYLPEFIQSTCRDGRRLCRQHRRSDDRHVMAYVANKLSVGLADKTLDDAAKVAAAPATWLTRRRDGGGRRAACRLDSQLFLARARAGRRGRLGQPAQAGRWRRQSADKFDSGTCVGQDTLPRASTAERSRWPSASRTQTKSCRLIAGQMCWDHRYLLADFG